MSLPIEMMVNIFSFCDDNTIITLSQTQHFSLFHKDLNRIIEFRSRFYWNRIYINHIEDVMRPIMEKHMYNIYFGGVKYVMTPDRKMFLEEWHKSDIEMYSTLLYRRIDNVLSGIQKEKDRLKNKYKLESELDKRPFIFNRLVQVSLAFIRSLM